jgi:RNA recognition motif-containing protein
MVASEVLRNGAILAAVNRSWCWDHDRRVESELRDRGEDRMEKRLFVGNLPYTMSESDLEEKFGEHGQVVSAVVIRDRDTGRSRGFGFVEMETEEEAEAAMGALDSLEIDGRKLRVNEAQPRGERPPRRDSW